MIFCGIAWLWMLFIAIIQQFIHGLLHVVIMHRLVLDLFLDFHTTKDCLTNPFDTNLTLTWKTCI
jgi:hypothetical protein